MIKPRDEDEVWRLVGTPMVSLFAGPGIADQRGLVTGLVGHAGTRLRVAAGRTSIDFLARVSYSYHRIGVRHGRGKGFTKAVGSGDGAAVCTTDASGRGRWRSGEGRALPEARAHAFIPTIYARQLSWRYWVE